MSVTKNTPLCHNKPGALPAGALFFAFVVAVFLLPCLSFGQCKSSEEFQVLNTQTLKIHCAYETQDGDRRVFGEMTRFLPQKVSKDDPTYEPLTIFEEDLYEEQSIVKTQDGYHQVDQVFITFPSGKLYLEARTLFDREDSQAYSKSPNGTFLHKTLIPESSVLAHQIDSSQCSGVGNHYLKADDPTEANQWAQAVLVNQQITLEKDRARRESKWGTSDLRYMRKVACLSNGEIVLSERQDKLVYVGPRSQMVETDVYTIITPDGVSTLAHSPGRYWLTAIEILKESDDPLWANYDDSFDPRIPIQKASR